MKKVIKEIFNEIDNTINTEEFKSIHKSKPADFTRTGKLSFSLIIFFVIGLINTSFDFERIKFCKVANIKSISNAALSKARDKVKFTAFKELLRKIQAIIPFNNRYKGYRVIAVDGIKGELPNTPEIRNKYGVPKGYQYPLFHAVASFDVLNCKFIDAEFSMSISDERKLAYTLLENHQQEKDILLYDRGFPSIALIQKLNANGQKFVARVSKSFIKEVNEFASKKAVDKTIHIDYTARRGALSRVKNVELPYSFELRCIKIYLKSGETEILITNLSNTEFKRNDISHLYALRWGIEIGFNHLKNAIHVEEFVGIKENSIKQEFYSVLIKYNILMLYINEADTMAMWNKKNFKNKL